MEEPLSGARCRPTLFNATKILRADPAWRGVFRWDSFAGRCRVRTKGGDVWLNDRAVDRAALWFGAQFGGDWSRETVGRAIELVAEEAEINPLRDYLEALRWDKKKRIDSWLTRYARVEDSAYSRAVGRKWLISAVARVMAPGCQADYVLVLEGPTRGGKSSLLRTLTPDPEWFLETNIELGSKDSYQVIRAKWIVELAELDSLSRSEVSRVKAFITAKVDTYRRSYGREVEDQLRQCVFAATVNPDGAGYFRDDTGNARFWPVTVRADQTNPLDLGVLRGDRDQLWAEAVAAYQAGEKWFIEDPEIIAAAVEIQAERRIRDPWEDEIAYLLRGKREVTVRGLAISLGVAVERQTKTETGRIARILRHLGWAIWGTPVRNGVRVKVYRQVGPGGLFLIRGGAKSGAGEAVVDPEKGNDSDDQ